MTPASATTDRILRAAADLFAERGYANTTTRAIAEAADVNEVTLFRKFKNKRGILEALGAAWSERMAGLVVTELPDPANAKATLEALAHMEVAQATQAGPAAMRLVLEARSNPDIAEVMGEGPGSNFEGLAAYLADRQAAGDLRADIDARVMAEAFFALTSQTVMSRQVLQGSSEAPYGVPTDQVTAQLLEIFMAGVARRK